MNSNEARKIVQDGLQERKIRKQEAEREALREKFEQDMIHACNVNCAGAKAKRETMEQAKKRRAEAAASRAKAWELECKRIYACQLYGILCLVVLLVSALTKFPFWAAVTLIAGGAVFPLVYIFRLYNPIKR
jgi:hypothetical protein